LHAWYVFHHDRGMETLKARSVSEQVAAYLRDGIRQGRWKGSMPGRDRLAMELGVSPWSIQRGLEALEAEGLLVPQGDKRRRRIVMPEDEVEARKFKFTILPYEKEDLQVDFLVDLRYRLLEMGHLAGFASSSLKGMGMNVKRVAGFVAKNPADAWVVVAGSREVLEWFATQSAPTFALFGRHMRVELVGASPNKGPALKEIVRRLVELGHRRIVMLVREDRRKPEPGLFEQLFLEELEARGIETGPFNLPEWEESVGGFHDLLDQLFRYTPPTALLISEAPLFIAARDHLARRGILAPDDVSLICDDPHICFAWSQPPISHIGWDSRPLVRRVVKWADNIARGKDDRRVSAFKATFVEGGTIGEAKQSLRGEKV